MRFRISDVRPWAWASISAAITTLAVVGTLAEVTRRKVRQIAVLDPRESFDPYFGMAEYTFRSDPVQG